MKSWGYHNYHEEDEDYLFGLITDLDFCATRFDDLGWQRTGWTRRLWLFKSEGMTNDWSRRNIGDKVDAGIIGENNFKKILTRQQGHECYKISIESRGKINESRRNKKYKGISR